MSDYVVKVTIKNGRILRLMREAGIFTAAELSRRSGVNQQHFGKILNLQKAPVRKDGSWTRGVEDIAGVLGCDPEDMFTERQRTLALEANTREIQMTEPQVLALASGGDLERQSWSKIELQRLLGSLEPRERLIVEQMNGGVTVYEIGDELGISGSRVGQIGDRAFRKMRTTATRNAKRVAENIVYGPQDTEDCNH